MKLSDRLYQLLLEGITGNQKELVKSLASVGITTTQSSVSRALKKINAVKSVDEHGKTIYVLPPSVPVSRETTQPSDFFESLVLGITHNSQLIVIHTKPGTAMTVAKFIDDRKFDQVMGTIAGDDTIMVAPKNVGGTALLADQVQAYLGSIGIME